MALWDVVRKAEKGDVQLEGKMLKELLEVKFMTVSPHTVHIT